MEVFGVEGVADGGVGFFDVEAVEETVEILHVGDVTAKTDDGRAGEGAEALDVCEAGEGAVGCCL